MDVRYVGGIADASAREGNGITSKSNSLLTQPRRPTSLIAGRYLNGALSRITVWRVIKAEQEAKRKVSKRRVSDQDSESASHVRIDLGAQIDHYQPTLASSFNGGVGTRLNSWDVINLALRQVRGTASLDKNEGYQLRNLLAGKNTNVEIGRIRQCLKERMEQLFGFNGQSDKDKQFGDLNDLAVFLLRARKQLPNFKLKATQLHTRNLGLIFGVHQESYPARWTSISSPSP